MRGLGSDRAVRIRGSAFLPEIPPPEGRLNGYRVSLRCIDRLAEDGGFRGSRAPRGLVAARFLGLDCRLGQALSGMRRCGGLGRGLGSPLIRGREDCVASRGAACAVRRARGPLRARSGIADCKALARARWRSGCVGGFLRLAQDLREEARDSARGGLGAALTEDAVGGAARCLGGSDAVGGGTRRIGRNRRRRTPSPRSGRPPSPAPPPFSWPRAAIQGRSA